MRMLTAILAAAVIGGPAAAEDYTAGDLTIRDPIAYETAPTAMAGAGYMTITNAGDAGDRLIGIQAGFPRTEVHATEEQDGVARMRPVEGVDIAAGDTVVFEPGGLHVMFMGLGGDPFEPGEEVPAALIFERAGEVPVVFLVESRSGG